MNVAREYFEPPTECPSCKATLERDGEYLICRNEDCGAQVVGALIRWAKKIDVKHVGPALLEAWVESGMVADIADLYTLDPNDAAEVDLDGRRAGGGAVKAINSLNRKKSLPLHVLVGSLGIPLIGRSMSKIIVDAGFNSLSKMLKAKIAEIAAIPGVGQVKAESFVKGFAAKAGLIAKLLSVGIQVQSISGTLQGQSFCMTGFRDAGLSEAIERAGGTMKSSVSKGLTYLIAINPNSGSGKAQLAQKYGTKVISIDDAWVLAGGKP